MRPRCQSIRVQQQKKLWSNETSLSGADVNSRGTVTCVYCRGTCICSGGMCPDSESQGGSAECGNNEEEDTCMNEEEDTWLCGMRKEEKVHRVFVCSCMCVGSRGQTRDKRQETRDKQANTHAQVTCAARTRACKRARPCTRTRTRTRTHTHTHTHTHACVYIHTFFCI